MPISMKVELGGIFAPGQFDIFRRQNDQEMRKRAATGMESGGKKLVAKLRTVYAGSIKVSKKSFPKAIGSKLYNRKSSEPPALWVGSKVKAIAAHAFGANIPGPVLIPLLDNGRIGRKAFAKIVRGLVRGGNAEFRRVGAKTILFAEAGAAQQSGINIGRFRSAERQRQEGRGLKFRKQKGKALEVPIAVLVRNVHVKQSFNFTATVQTGLSLISDAVQIEFNRT